MSITTPSKSNISAFIGMKVGLPLPLALDGLRSIHFDLIQVVGNGNGAVEELSSLVHQRLWVEGNLTSSETEMESN